ncbi:MAG: copper amine oxidase N-terminal domain-containing protein [Armatimonadota bacterium]|nr:MAG: copper amine oxidase N-terminal domain-containing protein [Armatimonadota bacterium]
MRKGSSWVVLALILGGLAGPQAVAERTMAISTGGVTPFLFGGYSYVPLRSATDFLGAALLWDSVEDRAVVTYGSHELGLVLGSTTAYYGGRPVVLPAPPLLIDGRMLIPTTVLDRYLEVPVQWDGVHRRVLIRRERGWGYYEVLSHPPSHVVPFLRGHGPPPWAPAHGYRRKARSYPTVYAPTAFVHSGVTYVPLRDVASFLGAALLWDSVNGRAALTYSGREFGLVIGSRTVQHGPHGIHLSAPPVIVGNIVFVPTEFCERELGVEVGHADKVLKLKSPKQTWEVEVAPAPPGRVYSGKAKRAGDKEPPGRGGSRGRGRGRGRGG